MTYLEPALPVLLLIGLIGLGGIWRRRALPPWTRWLLTLSLAGIILLSTNAFAWLFSLPLEIQYDHAALVPPIVPEAIVVLSGSVDAPSPGRPYFLAGQDTYERTQHAVWLFHQWGSSIPLLVCGGNPEDREPYARTMKRVLESGGVPPQLIWTEELSRSTHENAVYGSQILRQRGVSRIALVVEASSMPRAAASFRKAGITVFPAPFRFTEIDGRLSDVLPNWRAIALNGESLHEYAGLLWYRLRGWI